VAKTESGAQFREALQELLFVLLPLVVLAVVMLGSDRSIEELSRSEEWSFAAAVLMGQAAVWAGADETRGSRSGARLATTAILVLGLVPALGILMLMLRGAPSRALVAAQIALFVLSVGVFIVAARAGRGAVPVIDGVESVSGHPRVRLKGFVQPPRKGVHIWFLRQHGSGNLSIGNAVAVSNENGRWEKVVDLWGNGKFRIHAVAANQSAELFFSYYRSAFEHARDVYRRTTKDSNADSFPGWQWLKETDLPDDWPRVVVEVTV
jgi:hypothetical protein